MPINNLASKPFVSLPAGAPPLKGETLRALLDSLNQQWQAIEEHHLEKTYKFRNFREALEFTNQVGELAEAANHHPDIYLAWGQVRVTLWTHSAGGLTENDFILAAKIEQIKERRA